MKHTYRWVMGTVLFLLVLTGETVQAAENSFNVTASSSQNYTINGVFDPDLTLVRGFTYTFNISVSPIHPFLINSVQGTGIGNAYNDGVTGNGTFNGTITFNVPTDAPSLLYYNCVNHVNMTGLLNIIDPPVVEIVDGTLGTNVVLQSTGSDALNLRVQTVSNFIDGSWQDAVIQANTFADGTNTTEIALPAGRTGFFRIQQGFFE